MYWINDTVKIGNNRQIQFFTDTNDDIVNLPTSNTYGVKQGNDIIHYLPCGKGSTALSIGSGDIFILNSLDQWIKLSVSSSGGGSGSGSSGFDFQIGEAILACFRNVAWANENGQEYYDELDNAINKNNVLVSIAAAFDQGSAEIVEGDSLEVLSEYLTVTANYSSGKTETISDSDYTLSGELSTSTSVITVTYNDKSTTFDVTVSPMPVLNVYVGKGISLDTIQVVDNAKRCVSDKVPFINSSSIKVQWEENTAYRWALKNETAAGVIDSNGGQWTPDMDSVQAQQDSSLNGWVFSSAEQTRWPMEPFASSSGYCRIVFAPLSGMNDALPSTLPSGYITITGVTYKIQIVE